MGTSQVRERRSTSHASQPSTDLIRRHRCGVSIVLALTAAVPVVAAAQMTPGAARIGGQPAAQMAVNPEIPLQTGGSEPRSSSDLTFGLLLQGALSDNLNLAPEGLEKSGRALELTPYVEGYVRTAKSRGDMALRLRGFWYSAGGDSDTKLNPDLRANGDLSVRDNDLRVAGSATVLRNNPSPFSATSVDPASRSADSDLYKAYAVSPYSLGRLGTSEYELRYRAQLIDPGGAQLRSTGQQVAGGLASDREAVSDFGWSTHADLQRTDFENDSGFKRSAAEALAYYGVSSRLRIGAGVNYSRIDVLTNADGDNHGFGPAGFFSWRPGPRTWMTGKYADTYYGSESSLRLVHQGVRWIFGLNYAKGLQAGTESGLLYFDPNAIFALPGSLVDGGGPTVRGFAERRLFDGAGQALLFGQTGSALVYNESLIASIGLLRPRTSFVLSLFANEQLPAASTLPGTMSADLSQRGANFSANHRLDPLSSLLLLAQYIVSESDVTRQEAKLATLSVGWRRNLSRQTTFTASIRTSRQSSAGAVPSDEYRERALIAAIDHRF